MKAINVPANCLSRTPRESLPVSGEYQERGNFIYIPRYWLFNTSWISRSSESR